ncbi:helix-turn-helix transcriptional regulator [Streptomyces misionensis]|uniref:Helix-turn-helix transcriptional regulator n=1 Tax=Streptomyces misionensis TaxID=67331 RepID=A0A5C6JYD4_9ACTN|nr:helix-turn-helix domain-containing protein [Streptomyces misionensis]TWV55695.1 helix-turn-helix transcriptional regulator [Streptomyces misionensis]
MPFRVHFTVEDLARTRIAAQPNPLCELVLAVRKLKYADHPVRLSAWRRDVARRLRPEARMVLDLVPRSGIMPGFLAPPGTGTADELMDRVRAVPRSRIRSDLEDVAVHRSLPAWTRQLADDPDRLSQLCDSLQHVHDRLLRPHWSEITAVTEADTATRARQVVSGGLGDVLGRLNPRWMRWESPVLEVAMPSGVDGDLHLAGRGLLLVPSVFGSDSPVVGPHAEPQPFLLYPAGGPRGLAAALTPEEPPWRPAGVGSLGPVLGTTRAAVLHAVIERPGCSTKELAHAAGIAPASASEHATVLREAGLIRTTRRGAAVSHSPTAAAVELWGAAAG